VTPDQIKLQAIVPKPVHRAAMVYCAQNATTLGDLVSEAICAKLGIPAPAQPKRGAPVREK
jgi:hypothetical protein